MLSLLLLTGCNNYELFNLAGYEQASFSNDADILFVIDNSASMKDESESLGQNFTTFIELFTSDEGSTEITDDLADAVGNFTAYVNDRGRFIDYNIGITTSSVDYTAGLTSEIDPGEVGSLASCEDCDNGVITKYGGSVEQKFKEALFCNATYWVRSDMESDPTYACGEETDAITQEYLDCLCGSGWDGNSGSGNEEPLEAAFLALCRAVENPPEECFSALSPLEESESLSNEGLIREDSTIVVVVIGDEGDNSRRMQQGQSNPEAYLDLFEQFEQRIKFATIGPGWDAENGTLLCNSGGAQTWQAERLQVLAEETGGFYEFLEQSTSRTGDDCSLVDFSIHLEKLGELLNNLQTAFELASVPDVSSIQVYVDGVFIAPSPILNEAEYNNNPAQVTPQYGEGWSYSSSENAVVFWEDAVPDYNQDVDIFYRPLNGNPRELPFSY
ncbi:MAG: hypothetical protein CMK59_03525 [Proteobacteria bacterium]|nr:hypothetical protein [Pseudomonadota bacterium]